MPEVDTRELEARVVQVARRWQDDLADALIDSFGEERATVCCNAMPIRFPPVIARTIRRALPCATSS